MLSHPYNNITNIPKDYIVQDESGNFINISDIEKGGFMKYLPILIPVVLVIVFIVLSRVPSKSKTAHFIFLFIIASLLFLSENTIKTYTRTLYSKLGVACREELYSLLLQN